MAAVSLGATAASLVWLFLFIHFQEPGGGGGGAALWNAFLITLWCLLHSLLARDRVKELVAKIIGGSYVRLFYNAVAGITLMAALHLWQSLPGTVWSASGAWYWALTALYLLFVAGMGYCMIVIGFLDNAGLTPFIRHADDSVRDQSGPSTKGLYAYCRHPFYVFYILVLFTGPVMTIGRLEFAFLNILYCVIGVLFEERGLKKEYGILYDRYSKNVPRWVPRLSAWRQD